MSADTTKRLTKTQREALRRVAECDDKGQPVGETNLATMEHGGTGYPYTIPQVLLLNARTAASLQSKGLIEWGKRGGRYSYMLTDAGRALTQEAE